MQIKSQRKPSTLRVMALLPTKHWPYPGKSRNSFWEEVDVRSYGLICSKD